MLWSKVVAGVQLPLDARVLLAGDHTVWEPGGGDAGRALWTTHLRLLFCRAVWHLQYHRVATGKVFTAAAVVGLTAAWVGRAICLDWLRVVADLTRAHTLPSWCIIHKRFNLSQADFSKRWCLGDVLAQSPLMEQPCRRCVCMCLLRSQCQPSLLLWRRLLLRF